MTIELLCNNVSVCLYEINNVNYPFEASASLYYNEFQGKLYCLCSPFSWDDTERKKKKSLLL